MIRLVSLLVFIVLMALGSRSSLLIGGSLLVLLYLVSDSTPVHGLWRVIRRTRWLLFSIFLLYGWWTPGTPLWMPLADYGPSLEGLGQGAVRAGLLVVIVSAVHWVMTTTGRPELLGAVLALTAPLRLLGIPHERLAIRILLTLETVPRVQELLAAAVPDAGGKRTRLASLAQRARLIYRRVANRADGAETGPREVQLTGPVPRWQWGIPLLMALLLLPGHWPPGLPGLD